MTTTTEILARLIADRDAAAARLDYPATHQLDQEIIAHQQLARLLKQHAEYTAAGHDEAALQVASSIEFWSRQVSELPTEPDPADDAAGPADAPAADGAAAGRTRPRRSTS